MSRNKSAEYKTKIGKLELSRSEMGGKTLSTYIKLSKKVINETAEVLPNVFVDFDENGRAVGIEIL